MSAIHEAVSWGLSQVSVTARISIVFEIIRSVREAVLSRMERMLDNAQGASAMILEAAPS